MRLQEADYHIDDFRLDCGATLPQLRLHYRALGELRRDSRGRACNAVLILHGTTGSGEQFLGDSFAGELFGPSQPLDAARHFIMLPDAIGHGGSSKPSDGARMAFPAYGYRDMVRAQHLLLTDGLGVDHLKLVMGTSMGGMHSWLWGQMFPDFMDFLLPLAALPAEIGGRNRMMRRMIMDAIRSDPAWNSGNYADQPPGMTNAIHLLLMMTSAPRHWQRIAPTRERADAFLAARIRDLRGRLDANDMLYQFAASEDYDPAPGLSRVKGAAAGDQFRRRPGESAGARDHGSGYGAAETRQICAAAYQRREPRPRHAYARRLVEGASGGILARRMKRASRRVAPVSFAGVKPHPGPLPCGRTCRGDFVSRPFLFFRGWPTPPRPPPLRNDL